MGLFIYLLLIKPWTTRIARKNHLYFLHLFLRCTGEGEKKKEEKIGSDNRPGVICHTYAYYVTGDKQLTHARLWSCVCVRFIRSTNPHAAPLHSNMLMYLCSALIGPSDARPAPPVFMGSLQSVLQSGPRHCARICCANIMQTNTLLFGTSCHCERKRDSKLKKTEKGTRSRWVEGAWMYQRDYLRCAALQGVICQITSYPQNFSQSANEHMEKLVKVERGFEELHTQDHVVILYAGAKNKGWLPIL